MDDSEAGDRVGSRHESDGKTLNFVHSNGSTAPERAPQRIEALAGRLYGDEPAHPHAVGGWTFTDFPAPTAGAMELESDKVKDAPGVTTQASERPECPPGQLGIEKLTEKFTKMVTGAEGGPWPSGDGEAVEQLNLQDLHDLQAQDFAICD